MNQEDNSLAQIAESVFETMLGIEIGPARENEDKRHAGPNPEGVVAVVHFSGAWNGAVALEATNDQACEFAGAFLSAPTPSTVDGDVYDVMGELANMIGGNLKSTIAHGAHLSPPRVTGAHEAPLPAGDVDRQAFSGECGTFWVSKITPSKATPEQITQPGESPRSDGPENLR